MGRRIFSTFIVVGAVVLAGGTGCGVTREELCTRELPRLQAELTAEKTWLTAAREQSTGRGLASLNGQPEEIRAESREDIERAQDWALDRLRLTQQAQDVAQKMDRHSLKPLLTRLNNELVSYYGYAADLNWARMEKRLTRIDAILQEANGPLCE